MKTLIKLAMAALLIHASWRSGTAYLALQQFKDEVQAATQFAGSKSEGQICSTR